MIITTAICPNKKVEIKLPRTYCSGEAPLAKMLNVEENEKEAKADFDQMNRTYGKFCHVFQMDENGKILRQNDYGKVENRRRCIEVMGF